MLALWMRIMIIVRKQISNKKTIDKRIVEHDDARGSRPNQGNLRCPPMWGGRRCPHFGRTPTTHCRMGPFPLTFMVAAKTKKYFRARWFWPWYVFYVGIGRRPVTAKIQLKLVRLRTNGFSCYNPTETRVREITRRRVKQIARHTEYLTRYLQ